MYAYIVKTYWDSFIKTHPGSTIKEFLVSVGTPCIVQHRTFSIFNNMPGFFVDVPSGTGVKIDSSLFNQCADIENGMKSLGI